MGKTGVTINLTDSERRELESFASRRKTAQGLAQRARIVLLAAEGGEKDISLRVNAAHRSTAELETAIRSYLDAVNAKPKPFRWTKSADHILAAIKRFCLNSLEITDAQNTIAPTSQSGLSSNACCVVIDSSSRGAKRRGDPWARASAVVWIASLMGWTGPSCGI